MDNQHKHIAGYRDLTLDDVNLMNTIKAKEGEIAGLVRVVQGNNGLASKAGPDANEAARQIAIARTEFEHAFMRLVRAVARPLSPWMAPAPDDKGAAS